MTRLEKFVLFAILIVTILVAFSLDSPEYYGPGNVCPVNQPTNCN